MSPWPIHLRILLAAACKEISQRCQKTVLPSKPSDQNTRVLQALAGVLGRAEVDVRATTAALRATSRPPAPSPGSRVTGVVRVVIWLPTAMKCGWSRSGPLLRAPRRGRGVELRALSLFCNLSEHGRRPDTLESATGTQKEKVLRLLTPGIDPGTCGMRSYHLTTRPKG